MSREQSDNVADNEGDNAGSLIRCNVCDSVGPRARIGRYYGAVTCDCCRVFFKSNMTKTPGRIITRPCINEDNNCQVSPAIRKCQRCRLAVCIKIGMVCTTDERRGADNEDVVTAEDPIVEAPQLYFGPNTSTKMRKQFFDTEDEFGMSMEEFRMKMLSDDNGAGWENDVLDVVRANINSTAEEAEVVVNRKTHKRNNDQLSVVKEEDGDVTDSEDKKPKICANTNTTSYSGSFDGNTGESMDNEKLNLMAEGKTNTTADKVTEMAIMAETLANEARALYSDTVILEQYVEKHTMANATDPSNSTFLHDTILTGLNMCTANDVVTSTPAHSFVDVQEYFGNSINIAPKPKPGEVFAFSTGSSALTSRMAIRKSMAAKDIKNTAVVEKSESGVGSQIGQPGGYDHGHSHNDGHSHGHSH